LTRKVKGIGKGCLSATQSFPTDERFGLTNQIRRAIVSVSGNIAEGSTRQTDKEKARFYEIAFNKSGIIELLLSYYQFFPRFVF